ncbi:MAG: ATP-dependent DNA helicase RecQ, partial [Myxococcales bacterium]|nr:ATP-dependent DNA helicase RecQ [Myxococcales bacterium]
MEAARAVLREVFGHGAFREGQASAVSAALGGRDAIVVLPTGGGKSLCYQVPAVVLHRAGRGATVVVSPLIALMEDQVRALRDRGVAAVALHSGQDAEAKRQAQRDAPGAALIYVSPERLALTGTRRWLDRIGVGLFAIDEAHCLSEWGHDFRKDYQRLHELRDLWDAPVLALTATATPRVVDELQTGLRLRDPVRVHGDFLRPNLRFVVEQHRGDKSRVARVAEWLDRLGLGRRGTDGRAVVYAGTRKRVVAVAQDLRDRGYAVAHYHAGRTDSARANAQDAFVEGKARVLVATTAFGMGIDLPDVRLVAHVSTPPTLESYVQQAGRAGRDRAEAWAVLLTAPGDVVTRKRVVKRPTPGEEAGWRAMLAYAGSTGCRQARIADWFGVELGREGSCGVCDACTDGAAVRAQVEAATTDRRERAEAAREQRADEEARVLDDDQLDLVVELVRNLKKPVGKRLVALALRGSRSKPVKKAGLEGNP